MATTTLTTTGMHCQSCVKLVKMSVGELDGVSEVDVDLESGRTTVVHDEDVSAHDIAEKIIEAGYGVADLE